MMEKLYIDKPERSHPHKCALQPRKGKKGRVILKRKDPSIFLFRLTWGQLVNNL